MVRKTAGVSNGADYRPVAKLWETLIEVVDADRGAER
jgi:hypothetical protein